MLEVKGNIWEEWEEEEDKVNINHNTSFNSN